MSKKNSPGLGKTSEGQTENRKLNITVDSEVSKSNLENVEMPFGKKNYTLLLVFIGVIALGYVLLSSGQFVDATEFSVPLYVAPPIIIAGYVGVIYAIMVKKN